MFTAKLKYAQAVEKTEEFVDLTKIRASTPTEITSTIPLEELSPINSQSDPASSSLEVHVAVSSWDNSAFASLTESMLDSDKPEGEE